MFGKTDRFQFQGPVSLLTLAVILLMSQTGFAGPCPEMKEDVAITSVMCLQVRCVTMEEAVIANIVLRAKDGSSILEAGEPITSETVAKYKIEDKHLREVIQRVSAYGFKVLNVGPYSLSITGEKGLFERVFHTRLRPRSITVTEPDGVVTSRASYEAQDPIMIPEDLLSYVANLTFPVPPELFP